MHKAYSTCLGRCRYGYDGMSVGYKYGYEYMCLARVHVGLHIGYWHRSSLHLKTSKLQEPRNPSPGDRGGFSGVSLPPEGRQHSHVARPDAAHPGRGIQHARQGPEFRCESCLVWAEILQEGLIYRFKDVALNKNPKV